MTGVRLGAAFAPVMLPIAVPRSRSSPWPGSCCRLISPFDVRLSLAIIALGVALPAT